MKSEWRIASNIINGCTVYIAYRLRDANGLDHSGNREYIETSGAPYYRGGYTADRSLVERLVAELNEQITERNPTSRLQPAARKEIAMKANINHTNIKLAQTMTNGELYRYAWIAVRVAIENIQKWETPDTEELARLQAQEKELEGLMEESFSAGV